LLFVGPCLLWKIRMFALPIETIPADTYAQGFNAMG
jgi:hypothetical protein